jgi:hypothetical protein
VGGEVRCASIGEVRRLNQILLRSEELRTYVCRPVFLSYFFTDLPPHSSSSNGFYHELPLSHLRSPHTIRFPRQFQPDGPLWHRKGQASIDGLPRRCPTVRLDAEVEGSKASEVILMKAIDGSVTSANEAEARKTRRTRAWPFSRQAKFRPRHKCLFWHPAAKAIKALILL